MNNTTNGSQDRIKVLVIGAGLGGCAAALALNHHGHDVTVYEKLTNFRRLGDSLGLGENALKLLQRWGGDSLYTSVTSIGNQSEDMQIRRWRDGKILAQQPLMDMAGHIGHRGDYHEAFLHGVREAGIPIHMGCEVVSFQEGDSGRGRPSVTFKDGRVEEADVVVGAEGIKSRARELVLGFADAPKSSGYSCWRAYFPGEHLQDDPLCKDFVDHDCVNIWIGEDTHLVQNTLRNGKEFNWIITRKLSHEEDMEIKESWFQEGDLADVRAHIRTLDHRIAAAIEKTPALLDWKICYRDPLPTWVSRSHKIVLLGDSCHPHLPTSAQGASQATESAGVLAMCLKLAGPDRIPLATRVYEKIRFGRTRQSQTAGVDLRDRWHNALKNLEDGVEIDPESVKMRNRWLYAYDAEADTTARWDEVSEQVARELAEDQITPLCDTVPTKSALEVLDQA
ncbi:putative monooxygenase [Cryphonectria parasitica EP155]|uniref:Monooxygenase n=1 Tax=Cryphonectria parasitica (strain ATCC 38755 / EP155) TaxID=660469 RepID=A0A9P5CLZ3_CRYP1|nr:putative monooxygenase [Cryphonectria parasitica EP155]KAF3763593.1 putative monooxygenase [Cryphonectria parasitica EP155]